MIFRNRRTVVVTGDAPGAPDAPRQRLRRNIDAASKWTNASNSVQEDVQVFPTSQRTITKEKSQNDFNESKMKNGYYVQFYNNQTNASTFTFTIDKLRHFSMYSVSVQACRDFNDTAFDITTHCSNVVMLNQRTEKIGSFFPIPNFFDFISTYALAFSVHRRCRQH